MSKFEKDYIYYDDQLNRHNRIYDNDFWEEWKYGERPKIIAQKDLEQIEREYHDIDCERRKLKNRAEELAKREAIIKAKEKEVADKLAHLFEVEKELISREEALSKADFKTSKLYELIG